MLRKLIADWRASRTHSHAVLESSEKSLEDAERVLARERAKAQRDKAVERKYDQIRADNNLAELLYEAFAQSYRHREGNHG